MSLSSTLNTVVKVILWNYKYHHAIPLLRTPQWFLISLIIKSLKLLMNSTCSDPLWSLWLCPLSLSHHSHHSTHWLLDVPKTCSSSGPFKVLTLFSQISTWLLDNRTAHSLPSCRFCSFSLQWSLLWQPHLKLQTTPTSPSSPRPSLLDFPVWWSQAKHVSKVRFSLLQYSHKLILS